MQLTLLALIPLATAYSLPWFHGQTLPSRPPSHWRHRTTQVTDVGNGQTIAGGSDDYRLSTPVSLLETDQAGQTTASSNGQGSTSVPDGDLDGVTGEFADQRHPIPTLKHPTLPPKDFLRFSRPPRGSRSPQDQMRTMAYECQDNNCNTHLPHGGRHHMNSEEGFTGSKLEESTSGQDSTTQGSVGSKLEETTGQDSSTQVTGGQTGGSKLDEMATEQESSTQQSDSQTTGGSKLEESTERDSTQESVTGGFKLEEKTGQDSSTQEAGGETGVFKMVTPDLGDSTQSQKDVSPAEDHTQDNQDGVTGSFGAVSQPAESVTVGF